MRCKFVRVENLLTLHNSFEEIRNTAPSLDRISVVFGQTGSGKSTSIVYLIHGVGGIYVRAGAFWSLNEMTKAIYEELSATPERTIATRVRKIVEAMKARGLPLFIDEADYLLKNPLLLEIARDIHDTSRQPVWLIGTKEIERELTNFKAMAGRTSQEVVFEPCNLEDTHRLAHELCEVKASVDLVEKLHSDSYGNIRLICAGLSRIESFAKHQGLESIDLQHWGNRKFFLGRQLKACKPV
ncbi:MAG: ATP-binding protein [Oscillatoriophycideae cyanobacterium NC_groundwater_1537_Pr4_S-0.65um_50_18]|nr:ATP-binding protein [Oscillatoriophycideae cyanobacterium NC_groundwater_1537_Pr4_S-0.65um_50_18]